MGLRTLPEPELDRWVRQGEAKSSRPRGAELYTARLTIDVTTQLRGRIKVRAFSQGVTVAELLRSLLEREFPQQKSSE